MPPLSDEIILIPSSLSSSPNSILPIMTTVCDQYCQGQCVSVGCGQYNCGESCSESCSESGSGGGSTVLYASIKYTGYGNITGTYTYNSNSSNVTVSGSYLVITLPVPERTNYSFDGWLDGSTLKGDTITLYGYTTSSLAEQNLKTLTSSWTWNPQSATCTKNAYFYNYDGSVLIDSSSETESFVVNQDFTPSLHCPYYDSSEYYLYSIMYGSTNVTSGTMTCPSNDFTLKYYFRQVSGFNASCYASGFGSVLFSATYSGSSATKVVLTFNGQSYTIMASGSSGSYSFQKTITGLSANTQYSWNAVLYDGTSVIDSVSGTVKTAEIGTGFLLDNGSTWLNAVPYIDTGTGWVKAKSRLDSGSTSTSGTTNGWYTT